MNFNPIPPLSIISRHSVGDAPTNSKFLDLPNPSKLVKPGPKQPKPQILFHKKSSRQDFITRTLTRSWFAVLVVG